MRVVSSSETNKRESFARQTGQKRPSGWVERMRSSLLSLARWAGGGGDLSARHRPLDKSQLTTCLCLSGFLVILRPLLCLSLHHRWLLPRLAHQRIVAFLVARRLVRRTTSAGPIDLALVHSTHTHTRTCTFNHLQLIRYRRTSSPHLGPRTCQ